MMTSGSNAKKPAKWHAIALISDALTVTIMDMSQWIALTKYHLQAHQQDAGIMPLVGMIDHHLGIITTPGITTMTIGTGTDSVNLNLAHITLDTGVTVTVILMEVILDPFTSPHTIAHHAAGAPAHTTTTETHHTTDPYHAGIPHEMTVDAEHINPTNTITNPHRDHLPFHNQHPGSPRIESTNRLQLVIHPQSIIALMNRTVIQRII